MISMKVNGKRQGIAKNAKLYIIMEMFMKEKQNSFKKMKKEL